ncbi:MAG TPA: hypothetical protein VME63_13965 [Dyella sp.]|uniref:hypothetical protein n=1 Tax=Dyella sp. TaxID=1869338 RepID=UPI002CA4601C|nr:hypothetical protein [Dyella sp.]HTV86504.1 hypothetical protein [Dyella sp.]
MKYHRIIPLLVLMAATTACNVPSTMISNGEGGRISLSGDDVTLHVDGSPDATISSAGDLAIDDKPVSTTPSQKGLLMLYVQNVKAVHDQALALGTAGAKIGLTALRDKLSGEDSAAAKKQRDSQASQQADQYTSKLCQDQADIKSVQDQLAAQLPAFKPYGGIMRDKDVDDCRKDAHGN